MTFFNFFKGLLAELFTLSSLVVDSGWGRGLSRCASIAVGSSILLRMMGVARGDKSSGSCGSTRGRGERVSLWRSKDGNRKSRTNVCTVICCMTTTFLMSSSVAFLKSWSNGLASSLKSPTSSQFFRKRVGVGVWSAVEETVSTLLQDQGHQNTSMYKALTSNDDTVIPRWAELQCHLMLMFVDSQVVFICKSLWWGEKRTMRQESRNKDFVFTLQGE